MFHKKNKIKVAEPTDIYSEESADHIRNESLIGLNMSKYEQSARPKTIGSSLPKYDDSKHQKKRRFTWKRLLILILIFLLCFGGWFGFKVLRNLSKTFQGSIFSIFSTSQLKGQAQGRVNILLAGYSVDDPNNTGGTLTDSIMLISIDTKDNTAFLLSIPRDLWVSIPGYGNAKINSVYEDGQNENFSQAGYPNGGMGLLEQEVSSIFGVKIDYYGLLDNDAVKEAVDAVGGITINIQSTDPRGIYDSFTHLKLPNGEDSLNGQQALDLARARCDEVAGDVCYGLPNSDFDRTEHQREMLIAIKNKALTAGVLANPFKLSSLFDTLGQNVKTDLTLSNARELYDISKKISHIQSYGLDDVTFQGQADTDLLQNYFAADGEEALIPAAGIGDYSQFKEFISGLISSNPVVRESASTVILNASGIDGVAAANENYTSAKGLNVVAIGDANSNQASSTIIQASSDNFPATLSFLKSIYGDSVTTNNPYASSYPSADFIVLVGSNQSSL